jgi:hypothetical protein
VGRRRQSESLFQNNGRDRTGRQRTRYDGVNIPCHHGMARPQVATRGDALQVWRVAANILNKQSRTIEKGLDLGAGLTTHHKQ